MFNAKKILDRRVRLSLLASLVFVALICGASPAMAATAPTPGTWQNFGVLAGSTVTNTGPTVITGDVGVSPGTAVVGFPPGIVSPPGTIYAGTATAATGQIDLTTAFNDLNAAGNPCTQDLTGQDLGSVGALVPGVYCFSTSAQLTGNLTLNGAGVYVFRMGSTLTTASNATVTLGGASACDVYWQVGSSATLGTNTAFAGNILALTSITMNTGATLNGRALARNGAVTLDSNTTNAAVCGPPPPPPGGVGVFKVFSPAAIVVGHPSTLTITLTNATAGAATITSFTDNFPPGMVIASIPNASTTCGGVFAPSPGDTSVTLTGGSIPAISGLVPGFCTMTVNVTTTSAGSFTNVLPADSLVTNIGNNPVGPSVILTARESVSVPTLNEWGAILFMLIAGLGSVYYMRKYRRV